MNSIYADIQEFYEDTFLLKEKLSSHGFPDLSSALNIALAGSTGGEIFDSLHVVFREIENTNLQSDELIQLFLKKRMFLKGY